MSDELPPSRMPDAMPSASSQLPGSAGARPPAVEARPRLRVHVTLFLLTCITTTWVGVLNVHPEISGTSFGAILAHVWDGLPYSISIMAILLAHEMGHYVLARRHGVRASLPYFIPIPLPPVGTMGAVIRMSSRIQSRNALADVGAAGPLAGILVAIPVLAYGIHLSPVKPQGPGLIEGNSVLYLVLKYLVKGSILPGNGQDVFLHPMAWAGWVGLLVTMINLIPVGQLDGGHIAFACFGDGYVRLSRLLHRALPLLAVVASGYTVLELSRKAPLEASLALGLPAGVAWVLWWGLLHLLKKLSGGQYHPPVGDEPLTPGRRALCWLVLILFALILIPIPMRTSV